MQTLGLRNYSISNLRSSAESDPCATILFFSCIDIHFSKDMYKIIEGSPKK